MKLARPGCIRAPATIKDDSERAMEQPQHSAGITIRGFRVRQASAEKASNIQSREKGIALAKAKPRRPRMTVVCSDSEESAKEMQTIHPAIVSAASAKRRFSAARLLCR